MVSRYEIQPLARRAGCVQDGVQPSSRTLAFFTQAPVGRVAGETNQICPAAGARLTHNVEKVAAPRSSTRWRLAAVARTFVLRSGASIKKRAREGRRCGGCGGDVAAWRAPNLVFDQRDSTKALYSSTESPMSRIAVKGQKMTTLPRQFDVYPIFSEPKSRCWQPRGAARWLLPSVEKFRQFPCAPLTMQGIYELRIYLPCGRTCVRYTPTAS